MKMPSSPLARLLLVLLAAALAGCGRKEPAAPTTGAADAGPSVMEADLARTVAEQTDFYQIKTPADLPANLSWVNSDHLPEFANPNAKPAAPSATTSRTSPAPPAPSAPMPPVAFAPIS